MRRAASVSVEPENVRGRYLNNAGAGLVSAKTVRTMVEHLHLEAERGAIDAAAEVKVRAAGFYTSVGALLNARADDIAYMDSASRAWAMALYGSHLRRGDRVVTFASEFGSNLVSLFHYTSSVGATVEVVPVSRDGEFDRVVLREALASGASMVAMSHVAAHGSIVNPVVEVGALARQFDVTFLLDGCQAVGQIPVDVVKIGCDAYTGTGRKWLRGPRGTGFLYVRSGSRFRTPQVDLASADLRLDRDQMPEPRVEVRPDARQFELWERSYAGMLGLASAIDDYLALDRAQVQRDIAAKADAIRRAVAVNEDLVLVGRESSASGIVGFYARSSRVDREMTARLADARLAVSTMAEWDAPLHFPRGAERVFRVSPHYFTSDEIVAEACAVVGPYRS